VIAIDGKDQITSLTRYVRHHYPDVHIVARAVDRHHVYDLWHAGCRDIIRENYDGAIRMGRSALEALGADRDQAQAAVSVFNEIDRKAMLEVAMHYDPDVPSLQNEAMLAKFNQMRDIWEPELAQRMKAILQPDES